MDIRNTNLIDQGGCSKMRGALSSLVEIVELIVNNTFPPTLNIEHQDARVCPKKCSRQRTELLTEKRNCGGVWRAWYLDSSRRLEDCLQTAKPRKCERKLRNTFSPCDVSESRCEICHRFAEWSDVAYCSLAR